MAGRPKSTFSDEQIQEMSDYALNGCQNNTIATIMDIPMTSLKRHFGKLLTKKRCERKFKLREAQTKLVKNNPAMAIFLGKNELNQTDKQVIETKTTIKEYTEAELEAGRAAARVYKLRLAGGASEQELRALGLKNG